MKDSEPVEGGSLWQAAGGDFWRDLIPGIDEEAARSRVDSSAVDEEIRDLFLQQTGESILKLEAAIAAADARVIRNVAHSFQGTGGAVGVPEISAFGGALSLAARVSDWDRCAALVSRLRAWYGRNGGAEIPPAP
jgi:HPt (histidine-containing phosphotransfer) domain-containing protein